MDNISQIVKNRYLTNQNGEPKNTLLNTLLFRWISPTNFQNMEIHYKRTNCQISIFYQKVGYFRKKSRVKVDLIFSKLCQVKCQYSLKLSRFSCY